MTMPSEGQAGEVCRWLGFGRCLQASKPQCSHSTRNPRVFGGEHLYKCLLNNLYGLA